ncbi:P-loop containing nucleoside triphosphate hydrolase protein [Tribonema minus]|uniref:P-loop containing nucleoside triphosphate hydrolase protein n=1 Tax=Tribonema minus TaxID=303371 RepID=A0A835ZA34_9STRA|nr:P-loop containing nucleoside triphosphate hydrolase protein [Tribonema minus]
MRQLYVSAAGLALIMGGDAFVTHSNNRLGGKLSRKRPRTTKPCHMSAAVRVAIIGDCAEDGVASAVAAKYGAEACNVAAALREKKGRKTDKVKATVARHLADAASGGWVLVGFPNSVPEAELFASSGDNFTKLVVLRTGEGQAAATGEMASLISRFEGQVVEVNGGSAEAVLAAIGGASNAANSDAVVASQPMAPAAPVELETNSPEAVTAAAVDAAPAASKTRKPHAEKAEPVASAKTATRKRNAETAAATAAEPLEQVMLDAAAALPQPPSDAEEGDAAPSPQLSAIEASMESIAALNTPAAPSIPWYAAVAKPTKKVKKSALAAAAAAATAASDSAASKIVQQLASTSTGKKLNGDLGTDADASVAFGELELRGAMAECLVKAGISTPSPIQAASMSRIATGESVMLHAETGSGKTLAFLLPLMQRIAATGANKPLQVMVVVPTRELAVQIAREAVLLGGGATKGVDLFLDQQAGVTLADVKAPIVVGTAKVLAQAVKKTRPSERVELLANLSAVVCDEVDRLVDTLSKYATKREADQRKRHPRPIMPLLTALKTRHPELQVIASSATVGRPLRRELAQALGLEDFKDGPAVVRANAIAPPRSKTSTVTVEEDDADGDVPADLAHSRAVMIPATIAHRYIALYREDFEEKIAAAVTAVRALRPPPRRPLIFIPASESVNRVALRLRSSGLVNARPLHEAMGFASAVDTDAAAAAAGGAEAAAATEDDAPSGFAHATQALAAHDALAALYAETEGAGEGEGGVEHAQVLVASADSARGLHFEGVDLVVILGRARGPDEYVHLSGRTGRQGRRGTVVSVVTYKEAKAMKGWEAQLKFRLEQWQVSL